MRYYLNIYTAADGNFAVDNDVVKEHVSPLLADVRDRTHDMPLCYVWSLETGQKIVNSLNATDGKHDRPNTHRDA